jgi:flagellar motor switch protein FliN
MNQESTATQTVTETAPVLETRYETRRATSRSPAASRLMGVKLPIRVLLGRTQLCLRDIAQLGSGSVVELDCSPNDPVEIIVNDRVIARGEVVVVAGNYAVRITGIPAQEENAEPMLESIDLLNLSEQMK